jgi:transcriptional regulator with XRE-family HTH domain
MLQGPETASTGIAALDAALGGLYWGDNVVWEAEDAAAVAPFYAAVASHAGDYRHAAYVAVERSPGDVEEHYPGLAVVDARPGGPLADPCRLVEEIRRTCDAHERELLLFDSLDGMAHAWGREHAQQFFTTTCPLLLELGAVAYWSFSPSALGPHVRREVEEVTQCVLALGDGRLRIIKAEGRPFGVQGSVFRSRIEEGVPVLETAPAAARLGAALRAVRLQRHLSQSELARLAGVSPSAVSQAERGQRGLSLETLLDLTARLNITLDELLRGEAAPGYRLARRHDPHRKADGRPLPLLDDPEAGLRAYLVRLAPRSATELGFSHKGSELIAVASGLVQVVMPAGRPVLRQGEALLAERSGIESCRNLGDGDAMLFWILRDG